MRYPVPARMKDAGASAIQEMGRPGIGSTVVIPLMTKTSCSMVRVMAGASHMRFTDCTVGTAPGLPAIIGVTERGTALLTNPCLSTVLGAIGVVAGPGTAFFLFRGSSGG